MADLFTIYKLLPQSNCRQCYLPSCLAFAAAVLRGEKKLADCPALAREEAARLGEELVPRKSLADEQAELVVGLQEQVRELDLAVLAPRLGAVWNGERLVISCLGKDFSIDRQGRLSSECHVNPWLQLPLLRYILHCRGAAERGEWLPLARLRGGQAVAPLFARRCEAVLCRLADQRPEMFFDLVAMFGGRPVPEIASDPAYLLYPLPRLPFALCYQPPEEGLPSSLKILCDRSAEENATPDIISLLGAGIGEMFNKIIHRHQTLTL